jgi:hypothetical protein
MQSFSTLVPVGRWKADLCNWTQQLGGYRSAVGGVQVLVLHLSKVLHVMSPHDLQRLKPLEVMRYVQFPI